MRLPWWIDPSERRLTPEWMDRPDLDAQAHGTALNGLERINWLSLSHRALWPAIRDLARRHAADNIRVLDVACGGGDVTVRLARAARRVGGRIAVDGCDVSATAIELAKRRAERGGVACRFFPLDALRDPLPTGYDVICCSLFLHHLTNDEAEGLLSRMANSATRLVLVNDLVRSRWGYLLARAGTRLLTRSPIVHYDGPVSVAGAFTPSELSEMAARAGLVGATVTRRWPARMLLVWHKR